MNRNNLSYFFKAVVILSGCVCFAASLFGLKAAAFGWEFVLLFVFALLAAPRMSLKIPYSKFAISFSDPLTFFTFLAYGGKAAIVLSTLEMLASCCYLNSKNIRVGRLNVVFNTFGTSLSTAFTYFVWSVILPLFSINPQASETRDLIIILSVLGFSQFLFSSVFIGVASSLTSQISFRQMWKRHCFLSLTTQIVGAALGGILYKLVVFADFITLAVALIVCGVAYLNYRQSITEINGAVAQAEQADREKAEAERLRAEQAEKHIDELSILLEKEEQTADELRESKDALEYAAFHDYLTDLPNRAYFVERLNLLIEIGIEISHRYYVLFLDLNRFKNINDSLGHNVGDRVLRLVGKRLIRILREEDTIARLGGDEFAIILNDLSSLEEAVEIAGQVYEKLSIPFLVQNNRIFSDLHIGVAPFDIEHSNPEDVLRDADIAMHHAKEKQIGVAVFNKELRAAHLEKLKIEADLRFAVERGELSMHYQPLVSLTDGELVGFEALLRWQHPARGFVSPEQFIPIAEDSGLIIPVTRWILRETCLQVAEWQKLSPFYEKLIVSVNISGKHLADHNLVNDVEKALRFSNLAPESLKLEITESVAMENAEQTIQILSGLKNLGVQLSIDDFGTGYSSLNYLHRLPFDTLKIDRSFVQRVGEKDENPEILQTIIALAKNLKMRVVAEGIETECQLALLQNIGCDLGQGFLMSKPLPCCELEKLLYQKKNWLPFTAKHSEIASNLFAKEENFHLF